MKQQVKFDLFHSTSPFLCHLYVDSITETVSELKIYKPVSLTDRIYSYHSLFEPQTLLFEPGHKQKFHSKKIEK